MKDRKTDILPDCSNRRETQSTNPLHQGSGVVGIGLHPWDVTSREAVGIQREFASRVILSGSGPRAFRLISGCDVSVRKGRVRAAIVTWAHPRRMGLASHAGVWFDLPAVGVAKTRLTGTFTDPAPGKGSRSPLMDEEELIGWVLRTRSFVKPLFVSPGHRIGFEEAVSVTLECALRYRLPEPTRLAHLLSKNGEL